MTIRRVYAGRSFTRIRPKWLRSSVRARTCVVGQTGTGEEALSLFAEHRPDITLMDLRLPKLSAVDTILAIRPKFPAPTFVVLTTYEGDEDIHRALEAGAKVLEKTSCHVLHFPAPDFVTRVAVLLARLRSNVAAPTVAVLLMFLPVVVTSP